MELKAYLAEKKALIDEAIKRFIPVAEDQSIELLNAMNYSLFAGGKRLRPILCMAGAETVGGNGDEVLPFACALEMIHTYSLIHDDLPAMDNDDLRRGKPTNHVVFGEAIAILAGDALLTEAFNVMTRIDFSTRITAESYKKALAIVATGAGYYGMVGGQAVDIRMEGKEVDHATVDFIHNKKTGALITASVSSGAVLGGGTETEVNAIKQYGKNIGLAFQIADDILDIEGDSEEMGKPVGSDAKKGKNTYPAVYGLERSKEILKKLIIKANDSLGQFGRNADPLRQIASYIIERKK